MPSESLKLALEACGPWRLARTFLFMPALMFVCGFVSAGPSLGSRLVLGAVFTVCFYALFFVIYFYQKTRHGNTLKRFTEEHERISALSYDEAKETAIREIEQSGLFRAVSSTGGVPAGLPSGVADFFNRFDSVDFVLPNNPSAFMCVCRTLAGDVPGNPDSIKIGETYPKDSCLAFHIPTGAVVGLDIPGRPGWVGRMVSLKGARHDSIWHLFALMAAWKRLGDTLRYEHPTRRASWDKRPTWRSGVQPVRPTVTQ